MPLCPLDEYLQRMVTALENTQQAFLPILNTPNPQNELPQGYIRYSYPGVYDVLEPGIRAGYVVYIQEEIGKLVPMLLDIKQRVAQRSQPYHQHVDSPLPTEDQPIPVHNDSTSVPQAEHALPDPAERATVQHALPQGNTSEASPSAQYQV
ncbi:MAG: hypothetical protein Q9220_005047 [cf. Caloplaca sp. 1 TL-2023]